MEKKVLEMEFLDSGDKKLIVKMDEPKEDLSAVEIRQAMEAIVEADVFGNQGRKLVSTQTARLISTVTSEVVL